jgi:hypothetical protein
MSPTKAVGSTHQIVLHPGRAIGPIDFAGRPIRLGPRLAALPSGNIKILLAGTKNGLATQVAGQNMQLGLR